MRRRLTDTHCQRNTKNDRRCHFVGGGIQEPTREEAALWAACRSGRNLNEWVLSASRLGREFALEARAQAQSRGRS